jgi:hypothetical protein
MTPPSGSPCSPAVPPAAASGPVAALKDGGFLFLGRMGDDKVAPLVEAAGGLISISRGARSRRSGLNPPHGKNRRWLPNSTVAERRVTISNTEVAIIAGGAAGIAAGRLADARVDCLIVEARLRLGGRAWTTGIGTAAALDLGCGCGSSISAVMSPHVEIRQAN